MMRSTETVERILALCRTLRPRTANEKVLQDALEPLFRESFSTVDREAKLDPKSVVDFLVEETVAVEVKVDGSPLPVMRQLQRYAKSDRVEQIVLVTTRRKLMAVAPRLRGKPIHIAWLSPF